MSAQTSPRYAPLVKIASCGMATVFLGAESGRSGKKAELVAIKRPHEHLLEDPSFRRTLLDEARLASRIHHANVVDVRDVDESERGLQLVMDYVEGASLSQLLVRGAKGGPKVPPAIAIRILLDACAGLHAAHELRGENGEALGLVHRDVSPQNLLVGIDGVARVADFGLAKCMSAGDGSTTQGTLKGKLGYMAPEYVRGRKPDRRADVFALGVVLWESLAGKRLFKGDSEPETIDRVVREIPARVSSMAPEIGEGLDEVVARALEKQPDDRFATAEEMGRALEAAASGAGLIADRAAVGAFVRAAFGAELEERRTEADRSRATPRRSRRVALIALAIAVPLGIAVPLAFRANAKPATATATATTTTTATATATATTTATANANANATANATDPPDPPAAASPDPHTPRRAPSARPRLPPPNPYAPGARTH